MSKDLGGLGFKDVECFNQVLLGKQAWRLVKFSDSLLAKFLKSRYFDQEDFLSVDEGVRPSFGWRSMLFRRQLLAL